MASPRCRVIRPLPRPLAAIVATIIAGCSPSETPDVLAVSGPTMGTWYAVKVAHPPESLTDVQLRRVVERRLTQIDFRFSTYDSSSDLSRFNATKDTQWIDVPPEMAAVLAEAKLAGQHTDGAFDPTVGPLVNLWSFGPERRHLDRVPSDEEINQARARTGLDQLDVQIDPPAVRKAVPELYVDLSGIAKGYAADEVSRLLLQMNLENHMVEIGGEVKAVGLNARQQPWRVGIERPAGKRLLRGEADRPDPADSARRSIERVVHLSGVGLATSGDYRNYFQIDGEVFSHIIDPRTGRPVRHDLASASVIDPSCMRADALATAMMVLGPDRAMELAEEQEVALMLIVEGPRGFRQLTSSHFKPYLNPPTPDSTSH